MRTSLGVLCLIVGSVLCGSGADLDSTAEMVKQLQDSGVLEGVKAELEKMLKDKDARAAFKDQLDQKENDLRAKIAEQLAAMDDEDEAENEVAGGDSEEAMEFATSYAEEKSLGLSKEVLRHVSSIPAEAGKGKTAHFAQLSSLLDQISQAVKSAKLSVESLLKTKYKSLAELKEKIADDTKKYFKKEVEKEHRQQANKQPASSKPTKAVSDNQVANAIRGFAQMASTNPDMMVNMLLMGMSNYDLASAETIQMLRGYSKGLAKMEGFVTFVQYTSEWLAAAAESEEGEEFVRIVPLFMQESTREQGLEKLQESAQRHWEKFFSQLHNTDMRHKFLVQAAGTLNSGYQYLVQDEQKMMFFNMFLMTQGLPAIQARNIIDSVMALVDQSLKIFTTYKVDLKPARDSVKEFVQMIEKEYVPAAKFKKLNSDEQAELIARFLDENVMIVGQDIFIAHDWVHTKGNIQCAENIICSLNEHSVTKGPLQNKVTNGLSLMLGWTWGNLSEDEETQFKMFDAAELVEGKPCSERYPEPSYPEPSCRIFDWRRKRTQ